jgi:membrane-bound lytic murein transglycosylase D
MSDLQELADSAQEFFEENIDPEVLAAFSEADQEKISKAFEALKKGFESTYVIDVAELRQTTKTLLPFLESWEETYPLAIWLRTRLDYMEVAEALRTKARAKLTATNQNQRPAVPTAEAEREIWIEKIATRPWPTEAAKHVKTLKPVFVAEGVPPELVWIAEVESSFDPRARSPVGAAGLFQLMPATAKRFGLRTWPLDQRYRPEPSARAAAQYLKFLHGRFGDWRLALAAYNSGEGTVRRAQGKDTKASFDAISSRLPAETQLYVPKVEAVLLRREGIKLANLRPPKR